MTTANSKKMQTSEADSKVELPTLIELREMFDTKSMMIRHLASILKHDHKDNNKTSMIAKHMGIRYQHARNVLTQPLKK